MSLIVSTPNISGWGLAARGLTLHINKPLPFSKGPWIIDVENNLDGTNAGIGLTTLDLLEKHKEIYFFTPDVDISSTLQNAELVGHNVKYDVQMLRKWGIPVKADQIVWDTQLAEYVKDPTRTGNYGLKHIALNRFNGTYPDYKTLAGTGKKAVSIGTLPLDVVANYNGCDVLFTSKLYAGQLGEMTLEETKYLEEIELPVLRVLLEMEERGIQIDAKFNRSLGAGFSTLAFDVAAVIRREAGREINLNSHVQIKQLLLDKANLRLPSTAAEELKKYVNVPLVKDILRYRTLTKLISTYTNTLEEKSNEKETYRLHTRFNQCVTHTGRLSSSDPNLQNIPTRTEEGNEIRKAFIAKEGFVLVDADYSQIEPRLMAHLSQDPALLEIFRTDKDLYDSVSSYVGCERSVAKTLWLALAYNAGAYKIAMTANISMTQAQKFLEKMKTRFSQFFYWRSKVIAQAEIDGGVYTLFGRWIPIKAELAHISPNYKIQGSAAEIMKLAIQETGQFNPVCTVHDELIFEMEPFDCSEIKRIMENVVSLSVPLKVDIGSGTNWSEAKQ